MSDLIDKLKSMYAAFDRGDIAAIVQMVTEDVVWEYETPKEMPTGGIWRTPKGVIQFFTAVATQASDSKLKMTEYLSNENAAASFGRYQATIKATGVHVDTPVASYAQFRDGKMERFVLLSNTAAMLEAIRGRADSAGA